MTSPSSVWCFPCDAGSVSRDEAHGGNDGHLTLQPLAVNGDDNIKEPSPLEHFNCGPDSSQSSSSADSTNVSSSVLMPTPKKDITDVLRDSDNTSSDDTQSCKNSVPIEMPRHLQSTVTADASVEQQQPADQPSIIMPRTSNSATPTLQTMEGANGPDPAAVASAVE
jgi:hypothetical protein